VIPCAAEDAVFIAYLLRSVNYQSLLPVEVIVSISGIDPASSQRHERRWRAELDAAVPLYVLDRASPAFAGPNRQRGAEVARGEVVSFFDADDLQAPRRLEKVAEAFIDDGIKAAFHRFTLENVNRYPEPDETAWFEGAAKMYHRGWISVRKDVTHSIHWGNEPRAQEFSYLDRFVHLFGKHAIAFLPDFLGHYVQTGHLQQQQYLEFKKKALARKLSQWTG
jgi:glycosyltransferase involved in cell wall biosynthesis